MASLALSRSIEEGHPCQPQMLQGGSSFFLRAIAIEPAVPALVRPIMAAKNGRWPPSLKSNARALYARLELKWVPTAGRRFPSQSIISEK